MTDINKLEELTSALSDALQNASAGEWRGDTDTGGIYTSDHLTVGRVNMLPDLILCALAKKTATEFLALISKYRRMEEALKEIAEPVEDLYEGEAMERAALLWQGMAVTQCDIARQALQDQDQ